MEFNSVAITAAGLGIDAVAFEWLEHTIRATVSSILRRNKGAGPSGPAAASVAGARRTVYSLMVRPPSGAGGP